MLHKGIEKVVKEFISLLRRCHFKRLFNRIGFGRVDACRVHLGISFSGRFLIGLAADKAIQQRYQKKEWENLFHREGVRHIDE